MNRGVHTAGIYSRYDLPPCRGSRRWTEESQRGRLSKKENP